MCTFFSFVDHKRKYLYFDWDMRQKLLSDDPKSWNPDSHASVAGIFNIDEDKCDKYEYNPITQTFRVDQINQKRSREKFAEKWARGLDWSTIVKPLIIKPIINPLTDIPVAKIEDRDIVNLKLWVSVWESVWESVRVSVRESVRESVGASVLDSVGVSVWVSVGDSMRESVGDSMWESVGVSVRESVGASVLDSMWAYCGSFFQISRESWKYTEKIKTDEYPFQPCVDLWERGLVPSFDGTTWRLHGGQDADILYEIPKQSKGE